MEKKKNKIARIGVWWPGGCINIGFPDRCVYQLYIDTLEHLYSERFQQQWTSNTNNRNIEN